MGIYVTAGGKDGVEKGGIAVIFILVNPQILVFRPFFVPDSKKRQEFCMCRREIFFIFACK